MKESLEKVSLIQRNPDLVLSVWIVVKWMGVLLSIPPVQSTASSSVFSWRTLGVGLVLYVVGVANINRRRNWKFMLLELICYIVFTGAIQVRIRAGVL